MLSFSGRQHDTVPASISNVREKLTFEPDNVHETGTIVRADTTRLRIRERRLFNRVAAAGGWRVEPRLRGDKIETNGFEEAVQGLPSTDFRTVNLPRRPKINADELDGNYSGGMIDETAKDPESFFTYNLDSLDLLWLRTHNHWVLDAAKALSTTDRSVATPTVEPLPPLFNKRVKSLDGVDKTEQSHEPSQQQLPAAPVVCSEHDLRVTMSLLELEANEIIMNKISTQIDACRKVKTSLGLMLAEQDALKRWRSWSKNIARFVDFKTISERSRVSLEVTKEIFSYWLLKRYHHGSFYLTKNCTEPQRFDVERIRWQIFLLVIRGWLRNLRHDGERMRMLNDGLIRVKKLRKRLFQKRTELHHMLLDVVDDAEFEACFGNMTADAKTTLEKNASSIVFEAGNKSSSGADDADENSFIDRLLVVCDLVDNESLSFDDLLVEQPTIANKLPLSTYADNGNVRRLGRKPRKRRNTGTDGQAPTVAADLPEVTIQPAYSSTTTASSTVGGSVRHTDSVSDEVAVARPSSRRALRKRVRLMSPPPTAKKENKKPQQQTTAVPGDFAKLADGDGNAKMHRLQHSSKRRQNLEDDEAILLNEIAAVVASSSSATTSGNSSIKTMPSIRNRVSADAFGERTANDDDDSRSMGYNSLSGASLEEEVVVVGRRGLEGKKKRRLPKAAVVSPNNNEKIQAKLSRKRRRRDSANADADSSVVLDESTDEGDDDAEENGDGAATDDEQNTVVEESEQEEDNANLSADADENETEDADDVDTVSQSVSDNEEDDVDAVSLIEHDEADVPDDNDEENLDDAEDDEEASVGHVSDEGDESSSERSRSRASSVSPASVRSNDDGEEEFQSSTSASTYTSARSRRSQAETSTSSNRMNLKHRRMAVDRASASANKRGKNGKMVSRFVAAQHGASTAVKHRTTPSRIHALAEHHDHHANSKLGGLALGRVNNDALAAIGFINPNVRLTRSAQQNSLALYEKQKAAAEGGMMMADAADVPILMQKSSRPLPSMVVQHGYLRKTYHRLPPTR